MQIGIIGINHKSADVALRESLAKVCQRRFSPESPRHLFSYVLLSTCNRTELYFTSPDLAATHTYLIGILRRDLDQEFEHLIYSYFGSDCFFHLACVTTGIDSAIVGETEIQGQVKQAYERATEHRRLSRELHFLFQKCLKIGKEVRTTTAMTRGLPTLEEGILNAGRAIFGDLAQRRVLFVGVSAINHTIYKCFMRRGINQLSFANRTCSKAEHFANKEGVDHLPWRELDRWTEYDLTIFGTKCPEFLVTAASLKPMYVSRKLIIDLSVPRNADPRIGEHRQISLLNVDELNHSIDYNRRQKAAMLARVETHIIAQAVDSQVHLFGARERKRAELQLVS